MHHSLHRTQCGNWLKPLGPTTYSIATFFWPTGHGWTDCVCVFVKPRGPQNLIVDHQFPHIYIYVSILYIYILYYLYIHTYYKHYFGASASFGQSHITDHHGQFLLVTVSICHQLSGCCSVVSVSQRCPGKPPPQDWGPLLVGSHAPWPKFYKLNEGVSENGLHLPNVHLKSFIGKIWKHDDTPMDLGNTLVSDKPTVETKATSL